MNDLTELVDLPDPAIQPLVHPLDLPQARRHFQAHWAVSTLTSVPIVAGLAVLVWFATGSYLVPVLAATSLLGFGWLADRFFLREAWSYIPRRRQDRQRASPVGWELAASLLFAGLLAGVLLAIAIRVDDADVSGPVKQFTFGMAAVAGLFVVVDFATRPIRRREPRQLLFGVPVIAAVTGSLALASVVMLDSGNGLTAPLGWGAGTMLVIGCGVGGWRFLSAHRVARSSTVVGRSSASSAC